MRDDDDPDRERETEPGPGPGPGRGGAPVLGERPGADPFVLAVARSRISNALFATEEGVRISRYLLLQRAGAGGMGAIWSAWDPELERRVAIKLMHVRGEAAREYLLREGQALAKLSHPNIVPIYDVGAVEDQVYLVMEWIAGVTLRAYVGERRTVRQLVAIYLAAGAGVAAAHRAGIVQRDFKPDNVMIGDDGRVRVVDFGLAHATDRAADGAVAGTPRYMAPEQARGAPATPAADQYSFGVSLRESIATCGDIPAWLGAVIARATATDPADRFPDMPALLAALGRDPARVWRRRAAIGGALVATAAAFAVGSLRGGGGGGGAPDPCSGAADELAEVWGPARASALVAHVRALGPYAEREAPLLAERLSAYGARWTDARRDACLALRRDEVTPALYERGLACLGRARAALDAVATTLARVSAERLPAAALAARDLPAAERCLAEATIDGVPPPPPELAARVSAIGADATRARYLALATDPAALELARGASRAADALGYAPLVARARIALGAALATGPGAVVAFGEAAIAALEGSDDVAFVEAFARRLFVAARRGDAAVVRELVPALPFARALGRRTGDAGRFARALLYNNAATERLAAGDRAGAIAWLRAARAEPAPAERAAELLAVLGNLAMLVPDRAEREALFAEERARLERMLGAEHPRVLEARLRAALFIEDPHLARARLGALCEPFGRLHPQRRDDVVGCHYELAWLAAELGDGAAAATGYRAVAALAPAADPRGTIARAALAAAAGDPAAALALAEPLAQRLARAASWWDRIPAIDAWLAAAGAHDARAARTAALAARRAARAVLDDVGAHTSTTPVLRRAARIDAELALATGDRARAAAAIAWYRSAGGYDAALARLAPLAPAAPPAPLSP